MLRFVPPALLVAAAGWLASRWQSLPERWVVHWGPGGVPDGHASRTFGGVFGPLLFGVGLAVFLELMAIVTERVTRTRLPQLARPYGNLVRWISIGVMVGVCTMAVLLPSPEPLSPRLFLGVSLGSVLLGLVAGALGLVSASREMAARGEHLPKGYGPILYRNPEDPRLIVPKIAGVGWTFNFARPVAWLLLAMLLLPALAGLVIAFLATG